MKIKLRNGKWFELPKYSKEGIYIDGYFKKILDNVLKIQKKDWDCVFLIDGMEGSGKSTLSFLCGWYLTKGKLKMVNICEGSDDAKKKLDKLPKKSVLIIDEGSLIFSSKDSVMKEQRELIKILNVIRQKLMILIIVSPSVFDLNKYIAIQRSRFLLHVYTNENLDRGRFAYFGEDRKKYLYYEGKKRFNSYIINSEWNSNFRKFKLPFDAEYQRLKEKSLMEALHKKEKERIHPRTLIREHNQKILKNLDRFGKIIKRKFTQEDKAMMLGMTKQNISLLSKK